MKKNFNNNQGITLVALVVTIVVLIILAGISINLLLGQNGIVTKAEEARNKTTETTLNEQIAMNEIVEYINGLGENKPEEVTLPSTSQTSPYLPGPNVTIIEDSTIDTGLTIKDKNNNEWVWVVVPKSVTASATNENDIYTALSNYAISYTTGLADVWNVACGLKETQYNENKSKMLNSIKTYGGFWIGRYELGTDTIRTDRITPPTEPALIQSDKYPYNWISCSDAQKLCSELSPEANITSSVMYGIQRDLTLKFMEEKAIELGGTLYERFLKLKTDSSTWGNYANETFKITKGSYSLDEGKTYIKVLESYIKPIGPVLLTTGATERNKVLNIYDLAGNVAESTLQYAGGPTNPTIYMGGWYSMDSTVCDIIQRYYGYRYAESSSRCVLYK